MAAPHSADPKTKTLGPVIFLGVCNRRGKPAHKVREFLIGIGSEEADESRLGICLGAR